MTLILVALGILFVSGLAALLTTAGSPSPRTARLATGLGVGGAVLACLFGLVPTVALLVQNSAEPPEFRVSWLTPLGGAFAIGLDSLSALFALLIFGIGGLAAVYGSAYLLVYADRKRLGTSWFLFNTLLSSMVLVVVARNGLLFLVAWEVMALTSYFLVTFEREVPSVGRAGWIYLVATHLATSCLLVLFVLLRPAGTVSLDFTPAHGALAPGVAGTCFVLALVGFGTKAGLVPFHVWLPEAHPVAPSHVSALMSAVLIKLGVYGLLRTIYLLGAPDDWWGPVLLTLSLFGALAGIAQALYQRDLKRSLAYSSIENVNLVLLGLGLGLWGWSAGQPLVAVLGLAGGLLHVWNHALMKGLMFFAAGNILHGTGTRDIERLGGLMKVMPWTASLFAGGAVALSALPPLNGFVSEWLLYLGLLEAGLGYPDGRGLLALLAVGLLAVVGGLAAICYVRLCGIVALGRPRSPCAEHAHEAGWLMRGPVLVLAALCVLSGVFPGLVLAALTGVLEQLFRQSVPAAMREVPVVTLGLVNLGVWLAVGVAAALLLWLVRRNGQTAAGTWDCGFAQSTPRIQYTGRSFAEMMAEGFLPRPFRPRIGRTLPRGLFPGPSSFEASCEDPVTARGYEPLFERLGRLCMRLWVVQQGTVNLYLLYLLLLIFLGLAWMSVRTWVG
jgi:formate hydrogenlyase subunit 3/multisubunit Na+/H+ antiporter MnhD subunit